MPRSNEIRLQVARPCPVSWDSMAGDDKTRFCAICQKCVYNVSALSLREAQALVDQREGSICVTFFERSDGTVMTSDCAFGLERVRRAALRGWAMAMGLLSALGIGVVGADTFFSDNIRSLFGSSTMGAIAGQDVSQLKAKKVQHQRPPKVVGTDPAWRPQNRDPKS